MIILKVLVLGICLFTSVQAQEFGFGCLGLVGGYGGYQYQKYNASGLNSYIQKFNGLSKDSLASGYDNFRTLTGYRLGINFYRQNFKGLILTVKGFYTSISEKNSATYNSVGKNQICSIQIDSRNPGIGFDIGLSLGKYFSWKVLDAGFSYADVKLTKSTNTVNGITNEEEYSADKVNIGYSIGTGFIYYIIENYVSFEGTLGLTNFTVDKFKNNAGEYFNYPSTNNPVSKTIENGGFGATIQLNIGFPL